MAVEDVYNPTPTVQPSTQQPSDYNTTQSNPSQFGAQVGEAAEGVGKTLSGLGTGAVDLAIQRQGMINETVSTNAETQAAAAYGTIVGKYKSLEGLAAVNAVPQATQDIMQVRQQIRATLPNPAAQRSFDLLAARREGYALQDINGYGAQQIKEADKASANAAISNSIESTSNPSIAFNDAQFNDEYANIKFQIPRLLTNLGYGADAGTGMSQNKDGSLSFNDTTQGQQAKAVYQQQLDMVNDKVWTNRINTLAYDPKQGNVSNAIQVLSDNKDQMSDATYAKLAHQLAPAWRNEQAHRNADQDFSNLTAQWQSSVTQASQPSPGAPDIQKLFPGSTITSTARTPEHNAEVGGVPDSMHLTNQAVDFVPPKGTTLDQVKAQFQASGFTPTELIDEGDHIHVGWGPKNGQIPVPGLDNHAANTYQSQADYYAMNRPQIEQNIDQRSQQLFPGDSPLQDQYKNYMHQKISQTISDENSIKVADQHTILGYIQKNNITTESQLYNAPPDIRSAWLRMSVGDQYNAAGVSKVIAANSAGPSIGLGTDFYKHLVNTLSGQTSNAELSNNIVPDAAGHSPLTNSGFKILSGQLDTQQTPEGAAFAHAEQKYLEGLHSQYTGAGQVPGISATQSNPEWDKVLMDVIPKIQAGRAQGLTSGQMFTPGSKDYITTGVPAPKLLDLLLRSATAVDPTGPAVYKSPDDLVSALRDKKITRQQFDQIAIQNKWARKTPPPVPAPQ